MTQLSNYRAGFIDSEVREARLFHGTFKIRDLVSCEREDFIYCVTDDNTIMRLCPEKFEWTKLAHYSIPPRCLKTVISANERYLAYIKDPFELIVVDLLRAETILKEAIKALNPEILFHLGKIFISNGSTITVFDLSSFYKKEFHFSKEIWEIKLYGNNLAIRFLGQWLPENGMYLYDVHDFKEILHLSKVDQVWFDAKENDLIGANFDCLKKWSLASKSLVNHTEVCLDKKRSIFKEVRDNQFYHIYESKDNDLSLECIDLDTFEQIYTIPLRTNDGKKVKGTAHCHMSGNKLLVIYDHESKLFHYFNPSYDSYLNTEKLYSNANHLLFYSSSDHIILHSKPDEYLFFDEVQYAFRYLKSSNFLLRCSSFDQSRDNTRIFTSNQENGTIQEFSLCTGNIKTLSIHNQTVRNLQFVENELYSLGYDHHFIVSDGKSQALKYIQLDYDINYDSIKILAEGFVIGGWSTESMFFLLSCDSDGLKVRNSAKIKSPTGLGAQGTVIEVLDSDLILGASEILLLVDQGTLQEKYRVSTGRIIRSIISHQDKVIVGCEDGYIQIYDKTLQRLGESYGHDGIITSMVASKDKLITASHDTTIKIWDQNLHLIETLHQHADWIWKVELVTLGNRSWLVSTGQDGKLVFWDILSHEPIMEYRVIQNSFYLGFCEKQTPLWFWTNDPHIIEVYDELNGTLTPMKHGDQRLADYLKIYNNKDMIMKRLTDPTAFDKAQMIHQKVEAEQGQLSGLTHRLLLDGH